MAKIPEGNNVMGATKAQQELAVKVVNSPSVQIDNTSFDDALKSIISSTSSFDSYFTDTRKYQNNVEKYLLDIRNAIVKTPIKPVESSSEAAEGAATTLGASEIPTSKLHDFLANAFANLRRSSSSDKTSSEDSSEFKKINTVLNPKPEQLLQTTNIQDLVSTGFLLLHNDIASNENSIGLPTDLLAGLGLGAAAAGIGEGLGAVAEGVGEGLGALATGLGEGAQSVLEGAGSFVESTGTAVNSVVTGFGEAANDVLSGAGELATGLGEGISNVATGLAEGAGTLITSAGTAGKDILEGAGGLAVDLGSAFSSVTTSLATGGASLISATGEFASGLGEGISSALTGAGQAAKSVITGFGEAGADIIRAIKGEPDPASFENVTANSLVNTLILADEELANKYLNGTLQADDLLADKYSSSLGAILADYHQLVFNNVKGDLGDYLSKRNNKLSLTDDQKAILKSSGDVFLSQVVDLAAESTSFNVDSNNILAAKSAAMTGILENYYDSIQSSFSKNNYKFTEDQVNILNEALANALADSIKSNDYSNNTAIISSVDNSDLSSKIDAIIGFLQALTTGVVVSNIADIAPSNVVISTAPNTDDLKADD